MQDPRPSHTDVGPERGGASWLRRLYAVLGLSNLFDRLVNIDDDEAARPEIIAARTLQWVAVCGLIYRLIVTPVPVVGFLGEVGLTRPAVMVIVAMTAALVCNAAVLRQVLLRRSAAFLRRWQFLAADCAVAAALNLWTSAVIVPGSLDDAFQDVFWFYVAGTMALWAGLYGAGAAMAFMAASVPLQIGMSLLNGIPLTETNVAHVAARVGWLVLTMVVVLSIASLLRLSAQVTMAVGHRAGRHAEQVATLRSMHDTVLQTLEAIALQAQNRPCSDRQLNDIEATARQQAADLRLLLSTHPASGPEQAGQPRSPGLVAALQEAVRQATTRGLQVELVTAEVDVEPFPADSVALREAVGEALMNVVKHAGVRRAVVRAVSLPDRMEVTVRDHGRGFDPATTEHGFGLRESIIGRLRESGGGAEVESRPGGGTRLRLWTPR